MLIERGETGPGIPHPAVVARDMEVADIVTELERRMAQITRLYENSMEQRQKDVEKLTAVTKVERTAKEESLILTP